MSSADKISVCFVRAARRDLGKDGIPCSPRTHDGDARGRSLPAVLPVQKTSFSDYPWQR